MKLLLGIALASLLAGWAGWARADEVLLKNGDKITGTVGQVTGDTLTFTSPVLGSLSIKLSNIQSYKTDKAATVRLKSGQTFSSPIAQGNATQIVTADNRTTPVVVIKAVNPPPEAWTGAVVVNGALNRGNTNTATLGASANALLRRDDGIIDDSFALGSDYNYGNTGRGSDKTTTTDNVDAHGQYDRFLDPQFYVYGNVGYAHDRIADLIVRVTPGVGAGYQWFETPAFNFSTEGGAAYVYEDYQNDGNDQKEDFRLAYHLDKQLNDKVSVFHDVEYLAAFQNPADYLLNADVGIRADLMKNFFAQFKVVYKRNDEPAPGALKDDLAFLLGVGWAF
jgi:putative salt-induced outer membrane protein YdiY